MSLSSLLLIIIHLKPHSIHPMFAWLVVKSFSKLFTQPDHNMTSLRIASHFQVCLDKSPSRIYSAFKIHCNSILFVYEPLSWHACQSTAKEHYFCSSFTFYYLLKHSRYFITPDSDIIITKPYFNVIINPGFSLFVKEKNYYVKTRK